MKKTIIYLILLMFIPAIIFAQEGKVIIVKNGNTIMLLTPNNQEIKVKLYGIDCPDTNQDFGQQARAFTEGMVFGKSVELEIVHQDKDGMSVGIIKVGGKILNEELIKNGLAWHYTQNCKRPECNQWKQYEEHARNNKTGLWERKNPIAPWDFRTGKFLGKTPLY